MIIPKKLILDANILFSFFRHDSARRYLIEELLNSECVLFSPDFAFEELMKDKEKIIQFACIDDSEFLFLYSLLEKAVKIIKSSEYEMFSFNARELSPHKKDLPYFSLALFSKSPIWSDEKAFKEQSKIEIFSTKDLLRLLKFE